MLGTVPPLPNRDRFPGLRSGQPVRIGRRDGLLTGMDGIRVASCAGGQ